MTLSAAERNAAHRRRWASALGVLALLAALLWAVFYFSIALLGVVDTSYTDELVLAFVLAAVPAAALNAVALGLARTLISVACAVLSVPVIAGELLYFYFLSR